MSRAAVGAACAVSVAIGLAFIFVRAPHPWGWGGFDDYHELGLALARGDTYPTIDRPWGYAAYLALFFRAFGDRPVVPLVVQAILNGLLPLLVYVFAREEFDGIVAIVAAVLTGLFSFNTVYASTQASDALCTVIFMSGVVAFARARRRGRWRGYALAGALFGLAPQFRPNLILVAPLVAAFAIVERRDARAVRHAAILVATAAVMLAPWTIWTYRLTRQLMPTTTHGAMQLWYGTLQTGPYLKSRAHNPRAMFETASFSYTSLDDVPLVVTATLGPCAAASRVAVVYATDRDPVERRVWATMADDHTYRADVPPSPAPTAYYIHAEADGRRLEATPFVYFVSSDHVGDLDRHGDLLDVFDVVRMTRHLAWAEPLPFADQLDLDGDGRFTSEDLDRAVTAILKKARPTISAPAHVRVETTPAAATLVLGDESTMSVPRPWSGRITDVQFEGARADALLHTSVPFAILASTPHATSGCATAADIQVNAPFYRSELQQSRRYTALALDNIRRDPGAYLVSVAYRTLRVFFIEGSSDPHTAQQFEGGGRVYQIAYIASVGLFVLFAAGVWAAWRRGAAIALPLVLIAYIPATLAFVLTNMRYSLTVQPLMFVFVASTLVVAVDALRGRNERGRGRYNQPRSQ